MCRSCGHFVEVLENDGEWEVTTDECPECGGTAFLRNETGEEIDLDD